jgi:hypothetical protein
MSPLVVRRRVIVVQRAINLDDQPSGGTEKVHEVGTDWLLPPKPPSVQLTSADPHPNPKLATRHVGA